MGMGRTVDQVVGGLSRLLHGLRGAKQNTIADLDRYLDLDPDVLFPPPPGVPDVKKHFSLLSRALRRSTLSWKSTHEVMCPRYRRRHVREYGRNKTAWARWIHPPGGRQNRCLIYIHGWLEPGSWAEEAALFPRWLRAFRVDIVHVSLPFHGPRNPRGALFSGEYFWTGDLVRSTEAVRQGVHDVRSAMLWLREQGYEEIGVAGLSLGGSLAMVLACLEGPPDYVVPIISHLRIHEAVENAPILWRMKSDLEKWGIDGERRRAIFDRLGLARMRPRIPPEQQLWIEARDDGYIAAPLVLEQWESWGQPQILWLSGGHMTFPLGLDAIDVRMAEFLDGLPTRS